MASAKIETWKKSASAAVIELCKEINSAVQEFEELEKKRKALQDRFEKASRDASKGLKCAGYTEADEADVIKHEAAIKNATLQTLKPLRAHGDIVWRALITKTSVTVDFDIKWPKK